MELLIAVAAAVSLSVAGRTSATPTVAADGAFVVVAWSASDDAGTTDVYVAVSRDAARTFAPPVRVNSTPGGARANGEQPPRVALTGGAGAVPAITVVWTAKGKLGTALVSARSTDGGRSFGPDAVLPDTDVEGNRGWHNVAVDPSGRIFAVWLDHRELARDESMATAHHQHAAAGKPDGVAMAQKSKLYIESLDGAVTPHAVTRGVCYCCKTALAIGANGQVYAAWRHVYPGNLRDIAFARSADGGRTFTPPVRVSEDRWTLEGCPDDGPAMAADASGRVHVVWPTLVTDERNQEETIALFYASSRRGGGFSTRLRLPTEGVSHHPQIVAGRDGWISVAWDETVAGTRRVVVARARIDGTKPLQFTRAVVSDERGAVYPALAISGDATIAVWTARSGSGSAIAVARLSN